MRIAAVLLCLLVVGCASAPDIEVSCPPLRVWSATAQKSLADALTPIPEPSPIWDVVHDWQEMRDTIRACQTASLKKE